MTLRFPEFERELDAVQHEKLPVSASKIQTLTSLALDHCAKESTNVVRAVEGFIAQSEPQYKLAGLYVMDSISRMASKQKSAHPDREAFLKLFAERLDAIFKSLMGAQPSDYSRIARVVALWRKGGLYPVSALDAVETTYLAKMTQNKPTSPAAAQPPPPKPVVNLASLLGTMAAPAAPPAAPPAVSAAATAAQTASVAPALPTTLAPATGPQSLALLNLLQGAVQPVVPSAPVVPPMPQQPVLPQPPSGALPPQQHSPSDDSAVSGERQPVMDPSVPRNAMRVLTRTLYVGGLIEPVRDDALRALFQQYGAIETLVLNMPKRNAFLKMASREGSELVREHCNKATVVAESGAVLPIRINWACGYGPKEFFEFSSGTSVIPIDRLSKPEIEWMERSYRGGGPVIGGSVVEEPETEGFSKKVLARAGAYGYRQRLDDPVPAGGPRVGGRFAPRGGNGGDRGGPYDRPPGRDGPPGPGQPPYRGGPRDSYQGQYQGPGPRYGGAPPPPMHGGPPGHMGHPGAPMVAPPLGMAVPTQQPAGADTMSALVSLLSSVARQQQPPAPAPATTAADPTARLLALASSLSGANTTAGAPAGAPAGAWPAATAAPPLPPVPAGATGGYYNQARPYGSGDAGRVYDQRQR